MKDEGNLEWFTTKSNDILKHFEDKNDQLKKTTLSSLLILIGIQQYQSVVTTVMKKVNDDYNRV